MAILSWFGGGEQSAQSSTFSIPPGRRGGIPLLGQTLSFHDAAHDEVVSLVESTSSSTVRLNVINRNIALITSYEDAHSVLAQQWDETPPVSRSQAYEQLMAAFYSAPNLLLEDENDEGAKEHRQEWDHSISQALQGSNVKDRVDKMISRWLERVASDDSEDVDLYDACKDLGHDLALGTFLSLESNGENIDQNSSVSHIKLRKWSEEMLRGQFTLPVGVNVGFFQNAFSRGQAAKSRFDKVVEQQLTSKDATSTCPFALNPNNQLSTASLISHHSMFSSSLVVKAFASIATALLLQLFRIDAEKNKSLADQFRSLQSQDFSRVLESTITETERLSPPIIGVMRRVTRPGGIDLSSSGKNVPCGWDVWPYFPLINRDEKVFGKDASSFKADRYTNKDTPQPLTFGAGVKNCAGQQIIRLWLRQLAASLLKSREGSETVYNINVKTDDIDEGVQSWLGWIPPNQSTSWRGVKQLPTQRPRKSIFVNFTASTPSSS